MSSFGGTPTRTLKKGHYLMPEDKKDFLEFPLEDVSIPQAVALSMLAATKTVSATVIAQDECETETDNDRLQLLCEKLEGRFQDDLDAANAVRLEATEEDAPNEGPYTDIDGHHVTLVHEYVDAAQDSVITKAVVDNMVYALLCNERVGTFTQKDTENTVTTTCVKQWGHEQEHVDMEGNYR